MQKPILRVVDPNASSTISRTINARKPPNRLKNDKLRGRWHVTEEEVRKLKAARLKDNRYGFRDAWMLSTAFRSALRVTELVSLQWSDISWERGELHIRRLKGSDPSTHKLQPDALRAYKKLRREQDPPSPYMFTSQLGAPISAAGFRKMLNRLSREVLGVPMNPHSLRHGGLSKLSIDYGADALTLAQYGGHRQLQNLKRYVILSPEEFKAFKWKD
jgi:integrase